MNVGLIGHGYWGKIIASKLVKPINLLFTANSKFSYDSLLNNVDWVFVATPTNTHYEVVKKALNESVNVFCEKPFTSSLKETEELINLAKQKKCKLYINNIFLERTCYINFKQKIIDDPSFKIKELIFTWEKYGPFNGSLKNDLFYHDIYLFLDLINFYDKKLEISNHYYESHEDNLIVKVNLNNIKVAFKYDRRVENKKIKTILVNNKHICDFSLADNDPLNEVIQKNLFSPESIDYDKCQQLSIATQKLLDLLTN